ncbi:MAG TPA: tetratricopeptide repeat protein [Syntrophales bacterium]|nr:tetratricopeptide repeat protein [Syntrophales bacterium]
MDFRIDMDGQRAPAQAHVWMPKLVALALIVAVAGVFWNLQKADFLYYDDQVYVTENARVLSGITREGVVWAFRSLEVGFWQPLTWLSLMLDAEFYGRAAGGYHWTNVLLHLGGTLFLFMALLRMTGALWRSAFAAALFALHPLHVESVAWVAERKDVLSGFFWMLTLYAYAWYAERPSAKRYGAVFGAFACSLMAKPMGVTLPFALLLLDYWPLGRFGREGGPGPLRLVMEKVPLLLAVFPVAMLTVMAEEDIGAVAGANALSLGERAANALISYTRYLGKTVWPVDLSVFYPHPGSWPLWQALLAGAFLLGVSLLAVKYRRRFPYVPVGWFWFLGTLVPAIGIIQIGSHAMADRYTYIPLVGIFIAAAWGLGDMGEGARGAKSGKRMRIAAAGAALWLAALAFVSWSYAEKWTNGDTLFRHAEESVPGNYMVHNLHGVSLQRSGDFEGALHHFSESLRMRGDFEPARINMGMAIFLTGDHARAVSVLQEAIRLNPQSAEAYNYLGRVYFHAGRGKESLDAFARSSALEAFVSGKPARADLRFNYGVALAELGEDRLAEEELKRVLEIQPDNAKAFYHLARISLRRGDSGSAEALMRRALGLRPFDPDAWSRFGRILREQGRIAESEPYFRESLRISPENFEANYSLGDALERKGDLSGAAHHFREAVKSDPDNPEAAKRLKKLETEKKG